MTRRTQPGIAQPQLRQAAPGTLPALGGDSTRGPLPWAPPSERPASGPLRRRALGRVLALLLILLASPSRPASPAAPATAQVQVEELRLGNGMTFLLVPRPRATTVAAGWMVRAGSADDGPGRAGLSHLLEHLLFKGTRTIGARDLRQEEQLLQRLDDAREELDTLESRLAEDSARRSGRLQRRLEERRLEFESLRRQAESLVFLGQFALHYSELGATGLNANTFRDFTLYYVTLPSEKLEAWFWLESDRLLEPVFRQLFKELEVIREERRMRIESTPTGQLDEELRARFWGDHPYSWEPQGKPEDLQRITRALAREFFRQHYRAGNITAALVGGFDPQLVRSWARRYFERLPGGGVPTGLPPPARTEPRTAETRMTGSCECAPQLQVLYPGVAFGHPDAAALQALTAILNGRTGRLYRSLVLDQQLAFSAYSQQISWRRAGQFSVHAETKGTVDPLELLAAWDVEAERLRSQPTSTVELRRAVNRLAADSFRALKEPIDLLKQLLVYQGLGDWRYLNRWGAEIREVTPADLQRVAAEYLVADRRTVAVYRRPAGAAPRAPAGTAAAPEFGALP